MDSTFDPAAFLNSTFSEGADTRIPLHKAGDWSGYVGTGDKDINSRIITREDGSKSIAMDVAIYTEDPKARSDGMAPNMNPRARYTAWIDLNGNGQLDMGAGKSRSLGALLYATGFQQKDGKIIKPWSPNGLKAARLKYRVVHDVRKDTGDPVANVSQVLPAQ